MTEQQIFERLRPLVKEVTGAPPERIRMETVLVQDLGAESIDLLDLTFLIEREFGVTIEGNEFEKEARRKIPGGVYEKDGFLTEAAVVELKKALPEVEQGRLCVGLRKVDIPSLLTVSVFVHLIERKLLQKAEVHA